jgi:Lon protease-like protein
MWETYTNVVSAPPSPIIPSRLPVMMLSGCNLFPHGLLPLHIFEPRYREMLAEVLRQDRMFCIGTLTGPENTESPGLSIHPASAAGFLRACVKQADGCSNLLLQGIQRIKLTDFHTDLPFVTAAVEVIPSTSIEPAKTMRAMEEVRSLAFELIESGQEVSGNVADYLLDLDDPEVLGDLVAYHFVRDPSERHPFLEEACVASRLKMLSKSLEDRVLGKTVDE